MKIGMMALVILLVSLEGLHAQDLKDEYMTTRTLENGQPALVINISMVKRVQEYRLDTSYISWNDVIQRFNNESLARVWNAYLHNDSTGFNPADIQLALEKMPLNQNPDKKTIIIPEMEKKSTAQNTH